MNTQRHHPSHTADLPRLNRIAGQIAGVKRMIEEHRHCPDILVQLRAIRSALRGLEGSILERHLNHCMTDALAESSRDDIREKIEELKSVFKRYDE